jgi:hypothetical protein
MFAVFNKGKFVDWWLNEHHDSGWVDRTIASLGWNKNEVKVMIFNRPSPGVIFDFDENYKMNIYQNETREILNEETEELEEKSVLVKSQEIEGEVYFENGKKVV